MGSTMSYMSKDELDMFQPRYTEQTTPTPKQKESLNNIEKTLKEIKKDLEKLMDLKMEKLKTPGGD
jgi:hypothetical protein